MIAAGGTKGGREGDIPTPISDLVEHLLSLGLSPGKVVEACRIMERGTTTARASAESQREKWRLKKRRQRERQAGLSPGDSPPVHISSSSKTQTLLKESKKDESACPPLSPGDRRPMLVLNDWPEDYRETFWSKYPPGRKQDKAKVFAKLERLRAEGYLDAYKKRQRLTWAALLGGLDAFVATRPEPQFTAAPLVWLNGHRWDADYGDRTSKGEGNGSDRKSGQQDLGYAGIAAHLRAKIASRQV